MQIVIRADDTRDIVDSRTGRVIHRNIDRFNLTERRIVRGMYPTLNLWPEVAENVVNQAAQTQTPAQGLIDQLRATARPQVVGTAGTMNTDAVLGLDRAMAMVNEQLGITDPIQIRAGARRPAARVGGAAIPPPIPRTDHMFDIPAEPVETPEELTKKPSVTEAVDFIEQHYKVKLDPKKRMTVGPEIIYKEPDPVNNEEEVLVNFTELADTLAQNELTIKHGKFDETNEEHINEYIQLTEKYENIIKNNKRKVNA